MSTSSSPDYLIGVDVGGTFTDVVVVDADGESRINKALSVPGDEAQGIFDALEKAAADRGTSLQRLLAGAKRFVHGSTVAANALLEKRGARLGFVTTQGFRDTLVMRRMFRENMYDLRAAVPENILRRENVVEAVERVDRAGRAVIELTDAEIERIVERVGALDVDAVGLSFLFSFRNRTHEERVRDALSRAYPDLYVAASCDIAPEIRDYERASTTALSAYLGPKVRTYLRDLERRLAAAGLACEVEVMRSNGGVCDVEEAIGRPTDMLLSGPAGGVVGAMSSRELQDERDVISFDMGGTSCDISVIRQGQATSSTFVAKHSRFEGWDVLTPFLDIHALGSGGGSIAWIDAGGGLHVGPQSAGSSPGPACYGRGGRQATVTDANVWLGYLNPDHLLGREMSVDREAAHAALAELARELEISVDEVAVGIFDIVNAAMAGRVNVVLADKGYDARDFTLLCFGGAGAAHAPALQEELGLRRVIVPREAPAFSAAGLLRSDRQYDAVHTKLDALTTMEPEALEETFGAMEQALLQRRAHADTDRAGWSFSRQAEMRYAGQTHDVRVTLPAQLRSIGEVQSLFEQTYRSSFGYLNAPELIQLVNLRVVARQETVKPVVAPEVLVGGDARHALKGTRNAYFAERGGFGETDIYDGERLRAGDRLAGPAVIELPATTIVVRPGQVATLDAHRNVVIDMEQRSDRNGSNGAG